MKNNLKLCPFCRGEGEIKSLKNFSGKIIIVSVACKQCGSTTRNYASEDAAMEAWNTRVM